LALRLDDVDLVRDRALVERFQEGDRGAFDTLYTRYFDRLVRFCRKRVGDPHEAEEIAQEAFARALRALPSFEGERRFYPWMTVIAGRLCVDSHRRRGRSEPSDAVDLGVIEGGQEKIVDLVDVQILRTAMRSLAPRHREVLSLREHEGWSYQQIADHYGVTLGTVEALLFRARKALKREFMAVVGGDRNWAALPVLGAVLRRAASWKARAGAWASGLVPSAGASTVAAVLAVTAVGGAVGVGVLHGQGGGSSLSQPPAVVRVGSTELASTAISLPELLTDPSTAVAVAPTAGSGHLDAAPAASTAPTIDETVDQAKTSIEDQDAAHSKENSRSQPVNGQVGPAVYAGLDPTQVAVDAATAVDSYTTSMGVTP
jgi:RNA polymerase sigma-70 factor (ECF subfamily)